MSAQDTVSQRRSSQILIVVGCLVVASSIWMAVTNIQLRSTLKASSQAQRGNVELGSTIPAIDVVRIHPTDSEAVALGAQLTGPTAVLFLTSTCPYCARSLPQLAELERDLGRHGVDFLLIGLDGKTPDAFDTTTLELWAPANAQEARRFPVRGVPTLLLVSTDLTVLGEWTGEITPARVKMIGTDVGGLTSPTTPG